jgi:hypothetical protein
MSEGLMGERAMRMSTSPARGCGTGSSTTSKLAEKSAAARAQ